MYGILAGGNGSRMKSNIPKPLQEVSEKDTLLSLLVRNIKEVDESAQIAINCGFGTTQEQVADYVDKVLCDRFGEIQIVTNDSKPNGTGQGVQRVYDSLEDNSRKSWDYMGVFYGDVPSDIKSIDRLRSSIVGEKRQIGLDAIIGSFDTLNPIGKGRLVVHHNGLVRRIIEEKDCSEEEKQITIVNSGMGIFSREVLDTYFTQNHLSYQGEWPFTNIVSMLGGQYNFSHSQLEENPLNYGANNPEELQKIRDFLKSFQ